MKIPTFDEHDLDPLFLPCQLKLSHEVANVEVQHGPREK